MSAVPVLQPGHQVPHFTARSIDGADIAYADIWQRNHLVLVLVQDDEASANYVRQLRGRMAELTAHETICLITRDSIAGFPLPAVVVADRWGEVQFVSSPDSAKDLPGPDEIVSTLRHVQMQCPECEGEAT